MAAIPIVLTRFPIRPFAVSYLLLLFYPFTRTGNKLGLVYVSGVFSFHIRRPQVLILLKNSSKVAKKLKGLKKKCIFARQTMHNQYIL